MRLARIDETLQDCRNILASAETNVPSADNLLAQAALVVICAEFEQTIQRILKEKLSDIGEADVRRFAESYLSSVARDIKTGGLLEILNRFGGEYRAIFRGRIEESDDNQRFVTCYNSIIVNRNNVAHSTGSSATFEEIQRYYEQGHVILDFFRETLLATGQHPSAG